MNETLKEYSMKIELVGWGACSAHNDTRIFREKTIKTPTIRGKEVKVCQDCGKVVLGKNKRCVGCKKIHLRKYHRKYKKKIRIY